jgi:hypothetical protein
MNDFISGVLSAFSATIALFFLRFYRESKDRLFAFFSAAFGLLALDWLAMCLVSPPHESQHYVFLFRFLAFVLIAAGVVDKNRARS